nr:hypothetical protein [Hymenobacter wooponensis]
MQPIKALCNVCSSHLGYVFPTGPSLVAYATA